MKLHEDVNAFKVLLNNIHDISGYRLDVLEKDYYVVLILEELSRKQGEGLPAYFKGGTALYKALHATNRFSEDIDLSVETRGCSRTQSDKRLQNATKKYVSLTRDINQCITNKSEVIAVYTYTPITTYDVNDTLQRFGKLKVEATSFTISEPITTMEISPMIYELASIEQKNILSNLYDLKPFKIQTITLERIFVDKMFAAEAYVRKSDITNKSFEAAKHLYDLTVMLKIPSIIELLKDSEALKKLLDIRIKEEFNRLDGIPGVLTSDFIFFNNIRTNKAIEDAYNIMQKQYVLKESDRIAYRNMVSTIEYLYLNLKMNSAWNN